jgi:hypothetical protein
MIGWVRALFGFKETPDRHEELAQQRAEHRSAIASASEVVNEARRDRVADEFKRTEAAMKARPRRVP